jgi:hypothetical protein
VYRERSYETPDDSLAALRSYAVVLITDGEPNSAGGVCQQGTLDLDNTAAAARQLRDAGVPVYVIGIDGVNEDSMDIIAAAGGSQNPNDRNSDWFVAGEADQLADALDDIAEATINCKLLVEAPDPEADWGRAMVTMTVDDTETVIPRGAPDGWVMSTDPVISFELQGDSCNDLRAAAAAGSSVALSLRVACEGACQSTEELCGDLMDNDCDGLTDEDCVVGQCVCTEFETCNGGCPTGLCFPEECDGADNDCDGEVDEGCCVPEDEVCGDNRDNDCDGSVDEDCDCDPEVCDGQDNDCDGDIDEGCPPTVE